MEMIYEKKKANHATAEVKTLCCERVHNCYLLSLSGSEFRKIEDVECTCARYRDRRKQETLFLVEFTNNKHFIYRLNITGQQVYQCL